MTKRFIGFWWIHFYAQVLIQFSLKQYENQYRILFVSMSHLYLRQCLWFAFSLSRAWIRSSCRSWEELVAVPSLNVWGMWQSKLVHCFWICDNSHEWQNCQHFWLGRPGKLTIPTAASNRFPLINWTFSLISWNIKCFIKSLNVCCSNPGLFSIPFRCEMQLIFPIDFFPVWVMLPTSAHHKLQGTSPVT